MTVLAMSDDDEKDDTEEDIKIADCWKLEYADVLNGTPNENVGDSEYVKVKLGDVVTRYSSDVIRGNNTEDDDAGEYRSLVATLVVAAVTSGVSSLVMVAVATLSAVGVITVESAVDVDSNPPRLTIRCDDCDA